MPRTENGFDMSANVLTEGKTLIRRVSFCDIRCHMWHYNHTSYRTGVELSPLKL